jgi:oligopeptide/dipeptide ABC transporter ATP-binding protein
LSEIPGMVPPLHAMPAGCRFAPRCSYAIEACRTTDVALQSIAGIRASACLRNAHMLETAP